MPPPGHEYEEDVSLSKKLIICVWFLETLKFYCQKEKSSICEIWRGCFIIKKAEKYILLIIEHSCILKDN